MQRYNRQNALFLQQFRAAWIVQENVGEMWPEKSRHGTRDQQCDLRYQYAFKMPINSKTSLLPQLYNFYPSLGFLSGASKTVLQNVSELNAFLQKLFQEHKEEFNENNLTGFVDAFLMKQQQVP